MIVKWWGCYSEYEPHLILDVKCFMAAASGDLMPRSCTVCSNPQHQAIDQALVAGTPYRAVAERFAAGPASVYRHQQGHLPATMLKAREAQEVAHADGLLAQLQSLQ